MSKLCVSLGAGVVLAAAAGAAGSGGAFATYGQSYRTIVMPPTAVGSTTLMGDALPDGRLLAVTGTSVYVESGVQTGVMQRVADFDALQSGGASDPSFVRLSPDGTRVAVGLGFNKPLAVFPVGALGTPGTPSVLNGPESRYLNAAHYQGTWLDGGHVAVTVSSGVGSASTVQLVDVDSPDPGAPVTRTIVTAIDGAPAGVAFDAAGNLYTGNGYAISGASTHTGAIKYFPRALWDTAGPIPDFELQGTLVGEVLSADALRFDMEGNLMVGGGDFDGAAFDAGYFGVINGMALATAIGGGGAINPLDPAQLKRLFADGTTFGYYGASFNPVTRELYATETDFLSGGNTWYATVPAPPAGAAVVLGMGLTWRRRRAS